jgi:hemerythrin-like domain-containing protein
LKLCCELEHIADGLPDSIDRLACIRLGKTVLATTTQAHRREEEVLFPALLAGRPQQRSLATTLDRVSREHRGDEYQAEEVEEALTTLGGNRRGMSPDAIGYLLRGFFENQRRHIAFERELIRPPFTHSG